MHVSSDSIIRDFLLIFFFFLRFSLDSCTTTLVSSIDCLRFRFGGSSSMDSTCMLLANCANGFPTADVAAPKIDLISSALYAVVVRLDNCRYLCCVNECVRAKSWWTKYNTGNYLMPTATLPPAVVLDFFLDFFLLLVVSSSAVWPAFIVTIIIGLRLSMYTTYHISRSMMPTPS